jgi:hypothetical protein
MTIDSLMQEVSKAEDALKTMATTMSLDGDKDARLADYEEMLRLYQESQKHALESSKRMMAVESVSELLQGAKSDDTIHCLLCCWLVPMLQRVRSQPSWIKCTPLIWNSHERWKH